MWHLKHLINPAVRIMSTKVPSYFGMLPRSFHAFAAQSHKITQLPSITNTISELFPVSSILKTTTPLVTQSCGFKVKGRLRRRCKDCNFVVRQERLYVICKTHPRHKQMALKKQDKSTWILTHATQSPVRPY